MVSARNFTHLDGTGYVDGNGDWILVSTTTPLPTQSIANRLSFGRQYTAITNTSETTIVTATAAKFNDIYGLEFANTSATATNVTVKDGTGGTTAFVFAVPAGETRGFMVPVDSATPQAAVNTNWTATCSAGVSTLNVTALYIKN